MPGNIIFSLNGEHRLLLKVLHFRVDKRKGYAKPQVEVNAFEKIVCMSNGVSMLNRKRGYAQDNKQKEVRDSLLKKSVLGNWKDGI